jgi:hypothetical protein
LCQTVKKEDRKGAVQERDKEREKRRAIGGCWRRRRMGVG